MPNRRELPGLIPAFSRKRLFYARQLHYLVRVYVINHIIQHEFMLKITLISTSFCLQTKQVADNNSIIY